VVFSLAAHRLAHCWKCKDDDDDDDAMDRNPGQTDQPNVDTDAQLVMQAGLT
jgi:hypothetical protein